MADERVLEGGCGCGALRYEVRGDPIYVNNCHCRQCQRQTGSTSAVNAFYESDRVTKKSGETVRHRFTAGSGGDHFIVRCAECGTAVWSIYPRLGGLGLGVRVGTLDDVGAFRPDAIIFTQEAMPWVSFSDDIPTFERTYNAAELLPADRFARLRALIDKRAAQG